MKKISYKIFWAMTAVMMFIVLAGCSYGSPFAGYASAQKAPVRSAWIAYWDLDNGEKELKSVRGKLNRLSYFCAYFDENDQMFIPQQLSERKNKLEKKKNRYETYLSFVNDKQNSDGTIAQKDIEVLRRVFDDEVSMDKHIDEIVALTLQGGYDGIEIDYERIWKDKEIGRSFLKFADRIYQKAVENNLKMRIVLEPSTPFDADFLYGPEYVVMFYNLYGVHSEPGPKANKDFIIKTLKKMELLPGEKSVAIATGGCLWRSDGTKKFLTETEARKLAKTYKVKTKIDEASQCQTFSYEAQGVSHTVWYADVKTLNYWALVADNQGCNNISIWRLGGNVGLNKLK